MGDIITSKILHIIYFNFHNWLRMRICLYKLYKTIFTVFCLSSLSCCLSKTIPILKKVPFVFLKPHVKIYHSWGDQLPTHIQVWKSQSTYQSLFAIYETIISVSEAFWISLVIKNCGTSREGNNVKLYGWSTFKLSWPCYSLKCSSTSSTPYSFSILCLHQHQILPKFAILWTFLNFFMLAESGQLKGNSAFLFTKKEAKGSVLIMVETTWIC